MTHSLLIIFVDLFILPSISRRSSFDATPSVDIYLFRLESMIFTNSQSIDAGYDDTSSFDYTISHRYMIFRIISRAITRVTHTFRICSRNFREYSDSFDAIRLVSSRISHTKYYPRIKCHHF